MGPRNRPDAGLSSRRGRGRVSSCATRATLSSECGIAAARPPRQNRLVPSLVDDVAWPLRTERLLLRPAVVEDAESTWRFRRLETVSRWLTSAPGSLAEYRSQFTEPVSLAKSLVIELDGAVIGDLMVAVGNGWAQAEVVDRASAVQADLGWVLHPGFHGHGLATEAVEEVLRVCFVDLGLRRVTAGCFAANEASWRLMERVGLRREVHTLRESLHRSGEWLDGLGYALLSEEWRAR